MNQIFVKFIRNDIDDDTLTHQVNSFLKNHQNYKVKDFQYIHPEAAKITEFLMVLFEVEDESN